MTAEKKNQIKEIIRYLIVGGCTTIVSLGSYVLLVSTCLSADKPVQLQIANVVSWILAVTFAFIANRFFVFMHRGKGVIKELGLFYLTRIGSLLIEIVIMFSFVSLLRLDDKAVKLVCQVVVTIVNYIVGKFVVFREKVFEKNRFGWIGNMKVMHVLNTGKYSGAENVARQIIKLMKEEGIDCVYTSFDGTIRDVLQEQNIEFEPVSRMSVHELKRVIRKQRPDIIHAHDMHAGVIAALACGRIPFVSHIHNNNYNSRGISAKAILYYIAASKAKHIYWVSRSSFEGYAFHKHFEEKSSVLFNIINIEEIRKKAENSVPEKTYDIVFLGRLTPQKNPHRLLRVLKLAVEKNPRLRIAIIGTGEMDNEVKAKAVELGLSENLQFLGFQKNPYSTLSTAKVMVMTSLWEGTPMAALEAMALGVPIVSTPTDGMVDVVEDDLTGYLCDDDDELAERINDVVSDESLRKKLSQASRERAGKLMDVSSYKKQIIDVYRRICR